MKLPSQKSLVLAAIVVTALIAGSCSGPKPAVDPEAYKKEIEQWKMNRLARLTRSDGWLTLCGLFWLKEGENPFGSDTTNAIVFPQGKAPKYSGSIWLEEGRVRLSASKGVRITVHDSAVTSMALSSDAGGADPTQMKLGTLMFYVIKRGEQYAVRVKDSENPPLIQFKGLEYFPTDLKWRIDGKYEPYNPPKVMKIASKVGTVEDDTCPGAIVFDVDGKSLRLDAVIEEGSENQLFIMFSDETSGKETYGTGRQLYTDLPDRDRNVVLDFNKAYNWPCVFTDFATCPIPPSQNHLPVRVEAGEKMYKGH